MPELTEHPAIRLDLADATELAELALISGRFAGADTQLPTAARDRFVGHGTDNLASPPTEPSECARLVGG